MIMMKSRSDALKDRYLQCRLYCHPQKEERIALRGDRLLSADGLLGAAEMRRLERMAVQAGRSRWTVPGEFTYALPEM
ncbi:hypothetical protein JIR23_07340 [Bradyrhizobium diazoefficiens]|nr:hypothetical protein [Bradyrhizobium diazoefficiens]QQN65532.1 hypothetical protein JIR23_07340 [Bradyrhizobium diazoefficiens]